MFTPRMQAFKAIILLVLLAARPSSTDAETIASVAGRVSTSQSTCPFRSINYITQSLPQQCLTTSWTSRLEDRLPNISTASEHATLAVVTVPANVESMPSKSFPARETSSTSTPASLLRDTALHLSVSGSAGQMTLTPALPQETEADSPLDNANFLSFEEWKRQNLAKAGQSADNLGARAGNGAEQRRRPGGIHNALDSLGEDTEIEIDFGGFVDAGTPIPETPSPNLVTAGGNTATREEQANDQGVEDLSGRRKRGKDAGKTCKERSNYASFDCAATVLKTNPESKGSTAVLVENKDSYLLNVCSAQNKFFIVELCDDILIDTIVLANFEFFSSMFRSFRVSVSDRYPVKLDKWRELGAFEARNAREVQAFLVENPLIWARYLRVEFLTHFGNEYYCPVSLLRVHGTTMMEEFNHELKRSDSESDISDVDEAEGVDVASGVVRAEALTQKAQDTLNLVEKTPTTTSLFMTTSNRIIPSFSPDTSSSAAILGRKDFSAGEVSFDDSCGKEQGMLLSAVHEGSHTCTPEEQPMSSKWQPPVTTKNPPSSTPSQASDTTCKSTVREMSSPASTAKAIDVSTVLESPKAALHTASDHASSQDRPDTLKLSNHTSVTVSKLPTSTQPPQANPTTQESFFKSVHKRLQLLESNSTLSLQYIEEQSRILREAFSKVEKRQLAKTTRFLESLNTTVLIELREFRTQYDQIWQSTVLELSAQREQSQHEVFALSARLSLLADEIIFQKRIAVLQFGLILLCLGLILFSRHGSTATYLDFPPLVQNAISKSSANISRHIPHLETPPTSPPSTRQSSRYGFFRGLAHRRGPSDDSQADTTECDRSLNTENSPHTPNSDSPPGNDHGGMAKSRDLDDLSDDCLEIEEDIVGSTKDGPASVNAIEGREREFLERSIS